MPRSTVHFDADKPRWGGSALKAFTAAAVLGVAGWQFTKWWQNPIDHEGVANPVSASVPTKIYPHDRREDVALPFAAKAPTVKASEAPARKIKAENSGQDAEKKERLSNCIYERKARESYAQWQVLAEDSYEKFHRLSYIHKRQKQVSALAHLTYAEYSLVVAAQAQKTLRHLWAEQAKPDLSPYERYVLLQRAGITYRSAAAAGFYNVHGEYDEKAGAVSLISEERIPEMVGFSEEDINSTIEALPYEQVVLGFAAEWPKFLEKTNPTFAESSGIFIAGHNLTGINGFSQALGKENAKTLREDFHRVWQGSISQSESKPPEWADYHCAGLPVPEVR